METNMEQLECEIRFSEGRIQTDAGARDGYLDCLRKEGG